MKVRKPAVIPFASCVLSTLLACSPIQAQQQPHQPAGAAAAKADVQSLWEQAQQLRREGKLEAAIETTQKMLAKERKLHDTPSADIAISLQFLAKLQETTQDFAAAETSRKEVLAILTQVFGGRDRRTTDARLALEELQVRQKLSPEQRRWLAEAEQLHVQARQAYGERKALEALELEKQALKVRRELLGENHPDVATTCANIAYIYSEADVLDGAEQNYREALRIRRQQMGTSHPNYSETLDLLAEVLRRCAQELVETEKFAEATAALAEALVIRASRHGADDWRTRELRVELTSAARLAALTPAQRKELQQATEVNQEAVQLYGEEKYEEAAKKLDEALAIRRKLLGVEDRQTLTCIQNRAIAAADLGQDEKAERLFREVEHARWSLLGGGHADTRDSIGRLANLLEHVAQRPLDEDQFDQAIAKRRELLRLRAFLLGQDHWRVGDARRALNHAEPLAGLNDEQRKRLKTAQPKLRCAWKMPARLLRLRTTAETGIQLDGVMLGSLRTPEANSRWLYTSDQKGLDYKTLDYERVFQQAAQTETLANDVHEILFAKYEQQRANREKTAASFGDLTRPGATSPAACPSLDQSFQQSPASVSPDTDPITAPTTNNRIHRTIKPCLPKCQGPMGWPPASRSMSRLRTLLLQVELFIHFHRSGARLLCPE